MFTTGTLLPDWLRYFFAQFFFRKKRFAPSPSLKLINPKEGVWQALDDDPSFIIHSHIPVLSGWYMIELEIYSDDWDNGRVKFYFDMGNGFNESDISSFTFKSGKVTKKLCVLPSLIYAVRFDPMETSGSFQVNKLSFIPVSGKFSLDRMYKRLVKNHSFFKEKNKKEIEEIFLERSNKNETRFIDEVYDAYNASFQTFTHTQISYHEWLKQNENWRVDPKLVDDNIASFSFKPKISIILPTYNSNIQYLQKCIDSVKAQLYGHWQLCIADDASTSSDLKQFLADCAAENDKIDVIFRENNGHISLASNSALKLATGGFVTFLDHDDLMDKYALYFIAETINNNPEVKIIYTDEDKINDDGERVEPHFKSDWNPDLFFSQNYITHLAVYKRSLVDQLNGCRQGVEGSQDYDLLLRCLPFVKDDEIVHIPQILYHWRILQGSTAYKADSKSYTTEAGVRALENFFQEYDPNAKIGSAQLENTYRVNYSIPSPQPLVSLLIPTRDQVEVLAQCIKSILSKTTYENYEIIILDNDSVEQKTLDYFRQIERDSECVRVVSYPYSFNFSAINNFGVKQAKGDIIGLVNNDIEVISPNWMTEMVSHAVRNEIGCVGAKLYYPDDTIQHAGVICGIGGVAGHSHKYYQRDNYGYFSRLMLVQNLSAVTAACLFLRKSIYVEVGGFDEKNLKVAFNDVDFCLRVREAGYRNLWTPYAELYHHESRSRGIENTPEKQSRFRSEAEFMKKKWGKALVKDPYYNPNLSLVFEDFSLRV